mmetsp:Transcript_4495/g.8106  ORF Transcript_4495/g.8106 Transcript_4495/m.8106 type:complete len:276 (-) Transcript_4495:712-1539(-)
MGRMKGSPARSSMALSCSLRRARTNSTSSLSSPVGVSELVSKDLSLAHTESIWLTMTFLHGTPALRNAFSNLALSFALSTVGTAAMTNSVATSSRNSAPTAATCVLKISKRRIDSSCDPPSPNRLRTWDVALASRFRSMIIFPKLCSTKSGVLSKRKVCPVGAVSKTTRWNLAYFGDWDNCTTLAMATASSNPGGAMSRSSPRRRSRSWSASAESPKPERMLCSCFVASLLPPASRNSWTPARTSISMAQRVEGDELDEEELDEEGEDLERKRGT